jgi:hypothetical protein
LPAFVDPVFRGLEFKAGLVLSSCGIRAGLPAVPVFLCDDSLEDTLRDACPLLFRNHFFRGALMRADAEDACYNLMMLYKDCPIAGDESYSPPYW